MTKYDDYFDIEVRGETPELSSKLEEERNGNISYLTNQEEMRLKSKLEEVQDALFLLNSDDSMDKIDWDSKTIFDEKKYLTSLVFDKEDGVILIEIVDKNPVYKKNGDTEMTVNSILFGPTDYFDEIFNYVLINDNSSKYANYTPEWIEQEIALTAHAEMIIQSNNFALAENLKKIYNETVGK